MPSNEEYRGKVVDVFSGDDLMIMLDLGVDDLHKKKRVRLSGVDAPNAVHEPDDSEAGKVRRIVRDLSRERECTVQVTNKIGNSWVAVVLIHTRDTTINLNELLIARGYQFKRGK